MRKVSDPAARRMLSAVGAICALFVALFAELVRVFSGVDGVVLALYAAAAILFAFTAPRPRDDRTVPSVRRAWPALRSSSTLLLVFAVAVAIGLNLAADFAVYDSLRLDRSSVSEPVLWLLSLVILVAAAVVARPLPEWSPRRSTRSAVPPRLRRAFVASLGLILAGACAARFIGLGNVPRGINADEGDRAASAMSLLTGTVSRNLFASGWFYISNVYFWLLAATMKIFGLGFEQARLLSASTGWLTLAVVVWIALRHFNARVALLTAILGSTLAVSLQFARETTEATPTALFWALSIAFFLEARRRGGTWPWVVAGISGGLSLYFYPSGRLWVVLATLVCVYFVVAAGAGRRVVAPGIGAAALAALLTIGPFIANARAFPGQAFLRAGQTSVFSDDNATRLPYYNPHWNKAELLWAQIKHSFALFAGTGDYGGFWPTNRAALGWLLTVLVLVGVGWFTLSLRNTPRFTVALWFWVGFSGMVGTVETPNLQRMATAVPVLPLLAAATLDATASRVASWSSGGASLLRFRAAAAFAVVTLAALALAVQQAHFYFWTYAALDGWPQPTVQGQAVADQGNALVMTVGREAHQINAGWVRLLAPHTDRGGVEAPGSTLPLTSPPPRDLAFMLYPDQAEYLAYLQGLYPDGSLTVYNAPSEGTVVSVYRIGRAAVAARSGVALLESSGREARVERFGVVPANIQFPASLTWSATIHVPRYWNYTFRVGPGPARLEIDGSIVLDVQSSRPSATTTVSLARGSHLVTLEARVASSAEAPHIRWRVAAPEPPPSRTSAWQELPVSVLVPETTRHGLFATVSGAGIPDQQRVDGTLATCCFAAESGEGSGSLAADWRGSLTAPRSGVYVMRLFTQGIATLRIDGRAVITVRSGADSVRFGKIRLAAGQHPVELRYNVTSPSPGGLEWSWTPPNGEESIVPPSVLEPPEAAGVAPPVAITKLGAQPVEQPLLVIR